MKKNVESHPPFWFAALLLAAGQPLTADANPTGLSISSGSASLHQVGNQLNITVSSTAVLNWQNFNIASGEKTTFLQPSANSVALNLIGGNSASQIYGGLTANGTVILANANGFYFGPNSFVSVGGSFIATTAPAPVDLGANGGWQFTGMPPLASIVNYGTINVGNGKSLYLIAENIDNAGTLNAPGGNVDLAAGQQVLVSESPDGRGLSAAVTLPAGSVDNFGRVTADGGSIAAQAQVINQNGILQANSIQNVNGVVELVAADSLNLGANSQISAQGDNSATGSNGGTVTLKSDNTFSDTAGSQIITVGGNNGGNGGNVEISAPNIASLNSRIDAGASSGGTSGTFLLDPQNLILSTVSSLSGATTGSGGSLSETGASGFVNVNVNTAFANVTGNITLEASGNIYVGNGTISGSAFNFSSSPAINWNLTASTGNNDNNGTLTLEAGNSIYLGKKSIITDPNGWSINLEAGNLYLNGSSGGTLGGSLVTGTGNINLTAGSGLSLPGGVKTTGSGSIQLGNGAIETTSGGNITLNAGGTFNDASAAGVVETGGSANNKTGSAGNITLNAAGITENGLLANWGSGSLTLNYGATSFNLSSIATHLNSATITLETAGNITVDNSLDLSTSLGQTSGQFNLLAGGDLVFENNTVLSDENNWSLTLAAGYNPMSQTVNQGSGNIYLNGSKGGSVNGSISLATGALTLLAGNNIQLVNGSVQAAGGNVVWQAGGDISLGEYASVTDSGLGSVTLAAGYDFTTQSVRSGSGNIYINYASPVGNSSSAAHSTQSVDSQSVVPVTSAQDTDIQTSAGAINLLAGDNILAGTGSAYTTGGGNITALASKGDVDTGLWAGGSSVTTESSDLQFLYFGTTPNTVLGGFSTQNGGDVTIMAGANVYSTPISPNASTDWPGETGAYGAGNVTVTAAGQITGNYLVSDGIGTLIAGSNVGAPPVTTQGSETPGSYVVLSLLAGAWDVTAANDIYLNEVNNPNGTFNTSKASKFLFNYAPDASVNLVAGNAIDLGGGSRPWINNRSGNSAMSAIYAPELSLTAGAGGITLENSLVLYPSADGSLAITTTAGGGLVGLSNATLTMSDSSYDYYKGGVNDFTFTYQGSDAATPLQLENSGAVAKINVTGNWENLTLDLPEAAQINVLGNIETSSLQAWNLHSTDVSSINVGAAAKTAMMNNGTWNAATDTGLTVGGDVNLNNSQLEVLGPGIFNLNANTLEMDSSSSIVAGESLTPSTVSVLGGNLNINTVGNLSMTLTTSIVNYGVQGNLNLDIGGGLNIGNAASDANSQNSPTAGIFTSSGGNVFITAQSDIEVGQSRIATFDGGNLTVLSLGGNINCGDGSLGVTYVNYAYELNPTTGQLVDLLAGLGPNEGAGFGFGIPGSGIRANTFVDGLANLGNILVEAPNGSVDASQGGIVAFHFNSLAVSDAAEAVLDVFAGYELLGLDNQPLTASDLSYQDSFKDLNPSPTPADPYLYAYLQNGAGANVGQLVRYAEKQNITSSDSGIIGQVINAEATGEISGLFSGRDVSVTAPQLGSVVVFSHDPPVISGSSLDGSEPVIVSPTVDTAAAPTAAPAAEAPTADNAATVASKTQTEDDDSLNPDDKKRRKGSVIGLAQKVSRVTVVLPGEKAN